MRVHLLAVGNVGGALLTALKLLGGDCISAIGIRDLGSKSYVAPAVSSGTMQLLLTLRGEWHCSSVPLGDVWFGAKNRFTPRGLEVETLPLPDALLTRLPEMEALLKAIV